MSEAQLNSALNLMRRMPPTAIENSLAGLLELAPALTDDLLNHVDQPLQVQKDPETGKNFILCDYNRDGDSYRSPWSDKYYPELEDGFKPTEKLRALEVQANSVLDVYRKQYFDTGESSAYFFNTDGDEEKSFGACFLIHKDVPPASRGVAGGVWDSIHVFEVTEAKAGTFEYKLTTTVLVSMAVENANIGKVDLSGSMTQQSSQTGAVSKDKPHLTHMGKMLEDMELRMRNAIEMIYIQKTREIISGMRNVDGQRQKEWAKITASLNAAVSTYGSQRTVDG